MQGSVLRSKEMSVLVKPAGGGASGDEMNEVVIVGLCSVGKKVDRSDNRIGLQNNHHCRGQLCCPGWSRVQIF